MILGARPPIDDEWGLEKVEAEERKMVFGTEQGKGEAVEALAAMLESPSCRWMRRSEMTLLQSRVKHFNLGAINSSGAEAKKREQ